MTAPWRKAASVAGLPTRFVHVAGAELERVGPLRWQLSFAGQHRTLPGRSAPLDAAERALEEWSRAALGELAP